MALGKQARILAKAQVEAVLAHVARSRNSVRNRTIVLLSVKAGLRAKEIAGLRWSMVIGADGNLDNAIRLEDRASKGRSGRVVPLAKDLREALQSLRDQRPPASPDDHIIRTERRASTSAQAIVNQFSRWFDELGFVGCSSHSGRRTFITNAARRISTVGGSLRDVQALAGHRSLTTTQRYIEFDSDAQRRVVELL